MPIPREDETLAAYAAAGIGLQTGHDSVFGDGPRWVSRKEARLALAAGERLAPARPAGPDAVSPRAWGLAAALVRAWLVLPEAGSGARADPADLRVLARIAAALAAVLPPPAPAVSTVRCPPPLFAPDGGAQADARFGLDGTIALVCDLLADPGWVDPYALAGIVEDCRGWLRLCRRDARRPATSPFDLAGEEGRPDDPAAGQELRGAELPDDPDNRCDDRERRDGDSGGPRIYALEAISRRRRPSGRRPAPWRHWQ